MTKIYSNDPLLRFKTTEVEPLRTKQQIDGILGEWGVKDIHWHFDPKFEDTDVYVQFKIEEVIDNIPVAVGVKVTCPIIWDQAKRNKLEQINWAISMRVMYHYIYNALNTNYAMQSDRVMAFLPYVKTGEKTIMRDKVLESLKRDQLTSPTSQLALEG